MVTLYTQTGCAESPMVRRWLTEHGVVFIERNVTGDVESAMALAATGIFATPLVVNGDVKILGFKPAHFEELISTPGRA